MAIFFILLALGPFISFAKAGKVHVGDPLTLLLLVVMCISPLILLLAAPAKAISRRLIFLALGLLLLIALNELSKLGLDVTAPKPAAALLQHGTLTGDAIGVMIAADAT